jgi:natural product precursor
LGNQKFCAPGKNKNKNSNNRRNIAMKTKEIGKKLVLKKETIARISNREMSNINGGATAYCTATCPPIGSLITCNITFPTHDPTVPLYT